MIHTVIVLVVVLILVSSLFFYQLKRISTSNDRDFPLPTVKIGYWPILGHIVPFIKDKSKFIFECQQLYGPRFVMKMIGQRMIFLLDPVDWSSVNRNPTLHLPTKDFATKIFGISKSLMDDEESTEEMHRYFKIYLQNSEPVGQLTTRFVKHARDFMMKERTNLTPGQWIKAGILQWSHRMIFEPSGRAFFGDIDPKVVEDSFLLFDKNIHYFGAFLPDFVYSMFFQREIAARTKLASYFGEKAFIDQQSDLIRYRAQKLSEIESREELDIGAAQSSIFWASVGNTIPAAFWTFFYVLQDPVALKCLTEEIQKYLPKFSLTDSNDQTYEQWTAEKLAQCIYLDSAVNETLRMKGTPMVRKSASEDAEITLANGTVLPLKAGDTIFLFPEAAHHNPTYFPDPETFQFDRFVGKNIDIYKGFLTFGSGKTICPGRHFARNEIKLCLAFILLFFDFELLEHNPKVQSLKHRVGFGVAPPERDIPIRYRYKD